MRVAVLCMGGISSNPVKASKEKIDWFINSRQYKELDRADGEPMEFTEQSVNLSNSKDEFSSCQCVTTLYRE